MTNTIRDKEPYVIVFLTLVTLLAVSLLAAINVKTRPQIKLQKEKKIQAMLKGIYPTMTGYTENEGLYTVTGESGALGWALTGVGKGYGGAIELLVGVDTARAIKEVIIISHTETPGLGDKVLKDSFRGKFKGLLPEDVKLRKFGGKVDAITGATISSKAVTEGVYSSLLKKQAQMQGKGE